MESSAAVSKGEQQRGCLGEAGLLTVDRSQVKSSEDVQFAALWLLLIYCWYLFSMQNLSCYLKATKPFLILR